MSTVPTPTRDSSRSDVLAALSNARRRRILAVLERTAARTERELARCVAAERQSAAAEHDPAADPAHERQPVARERVRTIRMDLRHVHLPVLSEAGLVDWDRADGTVTGTARRVLPDETVDTIVERDADAWDGLFECLEDERRRMVLDALREEGGQLAREALAREVVRREDAEPAPEDVLVSLHHVHLPKLADVGLVEDGETVSYEGPPVLPAENKLGLLATENR